MFTTHTQLTALRRVSGLLLLLCALLMGGMRYGSHLGAASPPLTTEAAELSDDLPITEVKLTASDGEKYDYFGRSVSIDGDLALIGAPGAPYHHEKGYASGAAYVYRWNGQGWQEEGQLLAHDGAEEDYFGYSVSISGEVALVGAYGDDDNGEEAGATYIFRWDGNSWQEEQKLLPSDGAEDEDFGKRVAIRGNAGFLCSSVLFCQCSRIIVTNEGRIRRFVKFLLLCYHGGIAKINS